MPARRRARRRIEPWPLGLAAALCFMIGTSIGFWRVARANPDPLVVESAETAGRSYSERVRAARRTEALGWTLGLTAEVEPGRAVVHVAVRDAAGRVLVPERITLRRERPAEGGLDAEVPLAAASEGFAGEVALPRPGRWHLAVRVEREGETAERSFVVWAP
jgi:nitrogen fixation protein FixH